eukprot:TRINITY_DN10555_c0_g2_i1.p1 TRINITY_DN10555_c0_g2~~TRINITY_DN10555_c0_g2_i1.p1  ORF type:complete len:88 (+),score=9.86 TRINITY_DN10555_c0_g2_i1:137-400(+)
MNGTGRSGGAYGFKLQTLEKFASTKKAGCSVLQFVCETIKNQGNNALIDEVLRDLNTASKVLEVDEANVTEIFDDFDKRLKSSKMIF